LNKLLGATSSLGPIMMNIRHKLEENYLAKEEKTYQRKEVYDSNEPRLYSIPMLWSFIAK